MVRLVYSNRTEDLLAELAARVRVQQARDGALVPVTVVIPSAGVEGYASLGIARECGVAANLAYVRLTRFAADLVKATSGLRVADASALEAMALTLLLDDARLAAPEFAPVRSYLAAAGEATDAVDARRVQLASRIGKLFEEYTYSRGDMLAAWTPSHRPSTAEAALGDAYAEAEAWQRCAWLAMFGEGGLAARHGNPIEGRLVPLHQAVAALQPARDALPSAVHVFAFSHVARTFHGLLERVARVVDVIVYAVSPCEGFWEDSDAGEPTLLRLWGRPGREHVRALNALAGFDHDDRFVDPLPPPGAERPAGTLLRRLQHDLLRREQPAPLPARAAGAPARAAADDSVVFLEHAGLRRELEVVASEIWRLAEADDTLRFDDVAIVVPEADVQRYAAQLPAVFGAAHALPHRMAANTSLANASRVVEAIDMLLALPLGRFTRQDLLRIAVHPAVAASIDDVDPQHWAAWCDALGIVHGADRADHAETYIQHDILNWDQGLRRLALGAFMAGDASGDPRPVDLAGEQYVPYEVGSSELRDASALGLLVRSLLADARFARDTELSMGDWADFLVALVETYVNPAAGIEQEHLARAMKVLHKIRDVDAGGRPVRYRVAFEVARRRILALQAPTSGEGVVVTTLASMRPIPYRVVFACGMGEGKFPSPEAEDALDLRWARRREGDVTSRERDKYGFLEALLGARDRFYVSYVSRDPLTGEALAPSSVAQDLLLVLERGYVGDGAALRRHHPLRRWDPRYFPDLFPGSASIAHGESRLPEARAEARTLALRRDIDAAGAAVDREVVVARAAEDPAWAALAMHLGLVTLPDAARAQPTRVQVPVHAILKFLEFPLQGWARFRVGLDEIEDDDSMDREDELFETAARDATTFLRGVLGASIAQGCPVEHAYDEAVRARELRGAGPSGLFAAGERGSHLAALATWRGELEALGLPIAGIQVHRFGRGGEHSAVDQVHDALSIDVDVLGPTGVTTLVRVEIGGRTLPMAGDLAESLSLFKRANEGKDEWAVAGRERSALRAFLDHALLSASGVAAGRSHGSVVVVATNEGPVTDRVPFRPLSPDDARAWLRGVVRDLLQDTHAYFLPCEALLVHGRGPAGAPLSPTIERARELLGRSDGAPALRSAFGPVPRAHLFPAPTEAEARAIADRRLGPYFVGRGGEGEGAS